MTENFESLLEKVGGWGRYQIIVVGLISLTFIPLGFFVFTAVFTYHTPPHRCFIPEIDGINGNSTAANLSAYIPPGEDDGVEFSQCTRFAHPSYGNTTTQPPKESCLDGYVYSDPEGRISFNLVCENAWKKPVLTSGLIVGLFMGSFISGPFSDKLGRRSAYMSNLVISTALAIGFSFVPTYELALVAIVLVGASQMVWYSSSYILGGELVDRKHRATVACLNNVVYAIGYTLLPPVAYTIVDWRWIIRAYGFTCVAFFPYIWWLVSKGKTLKAFEIMKKIARVNGKDVALFEDMKLNNFDTSESLLEKDSPTKGRRTRRKSSVEILAKNTVMRRRSLLVCWIWNVTFLCYYALGFNTSNLGGNNYWNCFIAAAMEIPCFFFVTFSIQMFGRRNSVATFIGLAGIFLGIAPAVAFENTASIVFAMLGKFFAAATMSILFLYTSELYPTLLRSTGLGLASLSSRFGSICAPFLVYVGESGYKYVPFYVMAALGVVTAFFSLWLPETKQSPLPDTIADAIDLEKYRSAPPFHTNPRVSAPCKKAVNTILKVFGTTRPGLEKWIAFAPPYHIHMYPGLGLAAGMALVIIGSWHDYQPLVHETSNVSAQGLFVVRKEKK